MKIPVTQNFCTPYRHFNVYLLSAEDILPLSTSTEIKILNCLQFLWNLTNPAGDLFFEVFDLNLHGRIFHFYVQRMFLIGGKYLKIKKKRMKSLNEFQAWVNWYGFSVSP